MKVVASAATGEEAVILFKQFHPDVTLMDLQLPGMSGLDAIRAIRHEDAAARIIVLTMYDGEEDIHRALQEGAATYLLKDMLFDDLAARIRIVKQGDLPLPPKVGARLAQRESHRHLSPRETEVIELIVQGLRNKGNRRCPQHHGKYRSGASAQPVHQTRRARSHGRSQSGPAPWPHPHAAVLTRDVCARLDADPTRSNAGRLHGRVQAAAAENGTKRRTLSRSWIT